MHVQAKIGADRMRPGFDVRIGINPISWSNDDLPSLGGETPLDVALGKTIVGQLPVPHDSTVALIKKHGGTEGPGPRGARPAAP